VKIIDLLAQAELAGISKVGVTVMRIHGVLNFNTATASSYEYAIGKQAITTVGTQLPNPNADNDLDWMLFKRVYAPFSGATVNGQYQEVIDLKARRKVSEMGETLTLNLWAPVINAGNVGVFTRTLVALP
jgi:hypothetical protein